MQHKGTIPIETPRLLLRRFTPQDAPLAYRNWTSDDAVTKYLRWPTHQSEQITKEVVESWIYDYARDDFYQWAIELKEIGEPIGTIGVVDSKEDCATVHIGYCIGSKWWKQGITSEAFAAILPFLFNEVKVQRVEAQHDPKNAGSGRVMQKCGLQYEGTLRRADSNNTGIVDAAMYALLAEDYFKGSGCPNVQP